MIRTKGPELDLGRAANVFLNLSTDELHQHALERDACRVADNGAIVAFSGKYTGRSPKDKRTVREPSTESEIWWENNRALTPEEFARTRDELFEYAEGRELYVVDTYAGADPAYRIKVRFVVERAYHALFMKQLLIRPSAEELESFVPDWTIYNFCRHSLNPETSATGNDAIIALDFARRQVLIAGTEYAGELKKSVFTIMNFLLPRQGVMSMHCSANIGESGDVALFFGLSGTGKTTLSADPERRLIGDDEHGWSEQGVFNIEGGCYAKCIRLSAEGEPEIFHAIRHGAILENVVLDDSGVPDYDDPSLTENTRCAYPLEHIANAVHPSVGGHPKNIVFLTCDALGVLPPISRLSREQAMFYFLNGYTAKVAGTEAGVTKPEITFSTCFGAPFLPMRPKVYAELLGNQMDRHGAKVWLINTGWTGGGPGVGSRIKLRYTRAMIHAAFQGLLDQVDYSADPVFGLQIPHACPDVPSEVLNPRMTWPDMNAYDQAALELQALFVKNHQQYV